jgi:hypothetical protein
MGLLLEGEGRLIRRSSAAASMAAARGASPRHRRPRWRQVHRLGFPSSLGPRHWCVGHCDRPTRDRLERGTWDAEESAERDNRKSLAATGLPPDPRELVRRGPADPQDMSRFLDGEEIGLVRCCGGHRAPPCRLVRTPTQSTSAGTKPTTDPRARQPQRSPNSATEPASTPAGSPPVASSSTR